ncbi:MAG TPA: hypothetical protein VGC71_02290 [Gaiellales bacterium]
MEPGNGTSGQLSGAVDTARQKTEEQAGQMIETGRGAVRNQVDQRSTQAGQQVQSLASSLRDTATQMRMEGDPQKQRFAGVAESGADRLDRVGQYLTETDADQMMHRVEDFGRQQPLLIAGAGLLLGIAAGRFLKASSTNRYYSSNPQQLQSRPTPVRPAQDSWDTQPLPPTTPSMPADPTIVSASR